MMKHLDQARQDAISAFKRFLVEHQTEIVRGVLLDDLFGQLRAVLWLRQDGDAGVLTAELQSVLMEAAAPFWAGQVFAHGPKVGRADRELYERVWTDGRPLGAAARLSEQARGLGGWLVPPGEVKRYPRVLAFYSFKGGMGRTTALAAFALARAHLGDRVVVVDLDLDSPGAGALLAADAQGTQAPWGVTDYLLERGLRTDSPWPLSDYYHRVSRSELTGSGEILVFPAGQVNRDYLPKLARIDLEPSAHGPHPLERLLSDIERELAPNWILVDVRAGLSPAAGLLLSGYARLHILFGNNSEQSWQGLAAVLWRLGGQRVERNQSQSDVLLVQGMAPEPAASAILAARSFSDRAVEEFSNGYYAEVADSEGREEGDDRTDGGLEKPEPWTVADIDSSDAPHVPCSVRYNGRLAYFNDLVEVAEDLVGGADYAHLAQRIASKVGAPEAAPWPI